MICLYVQNSRRRVDVNEKVGTSTLGGKVLEPQKGALKRPENAVNRRGILKANSSNDAAGAVGSVNFALLGGLDSGSGGNRGRGLAEDPFFLG